MTSRIRNGRRQKTSVSFEDCFRKICYKKAISNTKSKEKVNELGSDINMQTKKSKILARNEVFSLQAIKGAPWVAYNSENYFESRVFRRSLH